MGNFGFIAVILCITTSCVHAQEIDCRDSNQSHLPCVSRDHLTIEVWKHIHVMYYNQSLSQIGFMENPWYKEYSLTFDTVPMHTLNIHKLEIENPDGVKSLTWKNSDINIVLKTSFKNLKQLVLRGNKIHTFNLLQSELENIEVLDLSYNKLKIIPDIIKRMLHLRVLNLRFNQILVMDVLNIVNPVIVNGLDLIYNSKESNSVCHFENDPIRHDSLTIHIEEIFNVTLSNFNLHPKNTDGFIRQFPASLRELNIMDNEIHTFTWTWIEKLSKVMKIQICGDKFKSVHLQDFQTENSHLQDLVIIGTNMTEFNVTSIQHISSFRRLQITDNSKLRYITGNVSVNFSPMYINFTNNNLIYVAESLAALSSLKQVMLDDNHDMCLCKNIWTLKWYNPNGLELVFKEPIEVTYKNNCCNTKIEFRYVYETSCYSEAEYIQMGKGNVTEELEINDPIGNIIIINQHKYKHVLDDISLEKVYQIFKQAAFSTFLFCMIMNVIPTAVKSIYYQNKSDRKKNSLVIKSGKDEPHNSIQILVENWDGVLTEHNYHVDGNIVDMAENIVENAVQDQDCSYNVRMQFMDEQPYIPLSDFF